MPRLSAPSDPSSPSADHGTQREQVAPPRLAVVTATTKSSSAGDGATVSASTTRTGVLAEQAGAGQGAVTTPASVQHPPDFEPRPAE
jgi:hypothetical protein